MKVFLLFIFLLPFVLSAQDKTIDSLKLELKNAKHDTTRLNLRAEIGEVGSIYRISYWDSIVITSEIGIKKNTLNYFYLKHLSSALNNIGFLHVQQGDIKMALIYFEKSLKIKEDNNDKRGVANTLCNIGSVYQSQGEITNALKYYNRSLKISTEINDKSLISGALNNLGDLFQSQGEINKALDCFYKCLKYEEEKKDKDGIALSLNNIGGIYLDLGDKKKALEYYQKSLKIYEGINDKRKIASSLNNIGVAYSKNADISNSLIYFNRSLKLLEELDDKKSIANTLSNLGAIYNQQGNISKSLEFHKRSLKLREEIEDKSGIAFSLNYIGSCLINQGNAFSALKYSSRSLLIAQQLGFPRIIEKASKTLKKIYIKQNKFKEALEMYELEIQMRDSTINTETKKASIKKQFQYQYEKQAAADSVKHAEEQKVKNALLIAQNAQLKQEKIQRIALYGGLVLVIAFLGFVFNRFKVTQKQKVIIEEQKVLVDNAFAHLEEKNKEVLDSIHYAKRIQTALLTSEKYIERKLNELN